MDNEEKVVDAVEEPETQAAEEAAGEAEAEVEEAVELSPFEELVEALKGQFGDAVLASEVFRGQEIVTMAASSVLDLCTWLRDTEGMEFNMLTDLTAVDNVEIDAAAPRFTVVYNLYSFSRNVRLRVKAPVAEGEKLSTVEGVWKAANWMEREVYDLFGIEFEGHSNLVRILLWDGYEGHPLRKDFPLTGKPQPMTYR